MNLFTILFFAIFTMHQSYGYTCQVRSKLDPDYVKCDITSAFRNLEKKCLNFCYIGTKDDYSEEMVYIESADSRNAFYWTIMTGPKKSESYLIILKEIYNFEIIGGNYENEIISLLLETSESLFGVFIDIFSPNVYSATEIGGANYSTGTFWDKKIVAVKNFGEDVKASVISLPSLKEGNGIFWMTLKKSIVNLEKPKFYGKILVIRNERENYEITIEDINKICINKSVTETLTTRMTSLSSLAGIKVDFQKIYLAFYIMCYNMM
uniref:Uncharacterized protein n=1 Tax=Panagrolaimus sp. JU765 TaxID=591449 RepID=A0AC34RNF6_9BILA